MLCYVCSAGKACITCVTATHRDTPLQLATLQANVGDDPAFGLKTNAWLFKDVWASI